MSERYFNTLDTMRRTLIRLALAAATGLAAAPSFAQANLDALVKAAKAEGEVVLYSAATENVAKKVGAAFTAKYGIKFSFVRLSSNLLMPRYSAEMEAGNAQADLLWVYGGAKSFADDGVAKGWLESIATADLPVIKSGEYPKALNRGNSAVIQAAPWGIAYNTERLNAGDVPKTFEQLINPGFKGQILIPDPRVTDAYVGFWALILDKLGEPYFEKLRAQNPRFYQSGVPMIQALAAGEGLLSVPALGATAAADKAKGAPLDMSFPDLTTGAEMEVVITAAAKAKYPTAGRLFANYVMSKEGNAVLNSNEGDVSIYGATGLPPKYEPPTQNYRAYRDQVIKLLGL
jgi:iron(III) transport system substrate-binding protein